MPASARSHGAYREAEHHYRNALAVLQSVLESSERDTRELSLPVALGGVMTATRGWSAVETAEVYARARMLRGELLLTEDSTNTVEADRAFRTATAVARRQGAKSWELRATTSLSRLLANRGRREEARSMLGEIYNSFTEGFDTADLKDAKTLLEELRS